MCGIAGFLGLGDQEDLSAMVESLTHRGPDEIEYFTDPTKQLYLGHSRLVIRDRLGGRQPMTTPDKNFVVVFNGEIYNAFELRRELESRGHFFRSSHSDTEVLIHGYREWGDGLAVHLNGMWAFAIFDQENQRMLLSRDRFGQKPLFYTLKRGIFAFSSEIKAFAKHKNLVLTTCSRSLQKYHAHGYFPGEHTIYKEIVKLPGGCNLVLDLGEFRLTKKRYWSYRVQPEYGRSEEYWVDEICSLLSKSVERRMVSDVPLGIFLSGGLDSSAIAILAQQQREKGSLKSFSVGFLDPSFDETSSAVSVSNLVGTQHSTVTFSPDVLPSLQDEMFALLDEPLSDSSMMSYYLLCRHASQQVTVALGGDAGDELFAGYDTFRALQLSRWMERVMPRSFHRGIVAMLARLPLSHSYMSFRFRLERLLRGYGKEARLWNPVWLAPVSLDELATLAEEPIALEDLYSEAIDLWDMCEREGLIDKTLEFYGNLFLQDQILVKVDRMSMMHSLEVRTPLLDIELVNCVRRIPATLKLKGNTTKYIFKKAMESYLPDDIVWRKKMGFSAPLGQWFQDGSIEFSRGKHWKKRSWPLIQEKITSHRSLESDQRLFLWNCYVLNEVTERALL